MVCRACGGTAFDATGTCLSCGTKAHPAIGTPSGVVAAAIAAILASPLSAPPPAQTIILATPPAEALTSESLLLPEAMAITKPKPPTIPARVPSKPLTERDPAATNPGSGVFCGRCGSAVDAQGDFCGICGNPLKEAVMQRLRQSRGLGARPTAQAMRTGTPALLSASLADTQPPFNPAAPHPVRLLIILGLVAALIASVALGVLVLHQH